MAQMFKWLLRIAGAMVVLSVDSPVDEAIVTQIGEAVEARFAKAVHLKKA